MLKLLFCFVFLALTLARPHSKTLVNQGWLELHSCHHSEDPYIEGTNIIDPTPSDSVDPVTATNDALTNLRAVFVKGYDGSLWGRWQVTTREGWGSWVSFGSPSGVGLRSIPKAITNLNSLITVFAIANDGQVYYIQQLGGSNDPQSFSNWTMVGSPLTNEECLASTFPTVSKAGDGRLFVYITVSGLVHESGEQTAGTGVWTDWKRNVMGELPITGTVSVALNTFTNYLEAFAIIGEDGCMHQAWQLDDESWRSWKPLWECWSQPTHFTSNVAVHLMSGSMFNGYLEIFARGDDNKIWHTWQTTCVPHENPWSRCTWGAYYSEANECPANNEEVVDLEVGSNIHGGLEVFVTGKDGNLYHIWQLEMWGSWSETWENLGHPERGVLTSQPRVVHDSSGWWMAYVRGIDGDLEIYVQQRTLKIEQNIVPYGTPIELSWSIPENEACNDDWLAVYQPQADNEKYLDFVYVQGEPNPGKDPVREGSYSFPLYLPEGWYEIRYNVNRQPKDVLRTLFKVSSSSELHPSEQVFSGMVIGLGERGWDFENCTEDLNATFNTFELAFEYFENKQIYEGLQTLGQAIQDFADSMKLCSDIYLAEKIEKFARDLRNCTAGLCVRFTISLVADIIVIYMNRMEIYRDIVAAENDFAIGAYENGGLKIGDFIQAIIR